VARDLHERGIEIEPVDPESLAASRSRVLARPAPDVEHRFARRIQPAQQPRDQAAFGAVVLERRVDEVVELGGGAEHWAIGLLGNWSY
jgi:hypothetical protein